MVASWRTVIRTVVVALLLSSRPARKPVHQTGLRKGAQWRAESDGSLRGGVQRIRILGGHGVSTR